MHRQALRASPIFLAVGPFPADQLGTPELEFAPQSAVQIPEPCVPGTNSNVQKNANKPTPTDRDNKQLGEVSKLALARLARYSSTRELLITQTFLFSMERLKGIRFEQGPFQATWFFGDEKIRFCRGRQLVGEIALPGLARKAA